jgi:hypothetical protein
MKRNCFFNTDGIYLPMLSKPLYCGRLEERSPVVSGLD